MKYKIGASHPHRHMIDIEIYISGHQANNLSVQLPSWRPGRYELGNFAKNVKDWRAADRNGNALPFIKTTKDLWVIETLGVKEIVVKYSYFANELTAGSSCYNEEMLYVNPVNCLMYVAGRENEPAEVEIVGMDEACEIACQMEHKSKWVLTAPNFDYLADSPFIVSRHLKHFHFLLGEAEIHLWFTGNFTGDFGEVLEHTHAYCKKQVAVFGELPSKKYHFLYHILPYRFHHGVEHLDSTVIALGPDVNFGQIEFYREFLSVSSHEFYHLWNIKRIRPVEMWPYDFTKENYSRQGYVYEGITTYMGDLMLLRSDVFEWDEYAAKFSEFLQRHFDNYGRYHLSVAASSLDTWLDGYVPGVFGRKVSIYVEGALAAFILDTILMKTSGNKINADELMRRLYTDFYKKGKGYSQHDYLQLINELSGTSQQKYFDEVLEGCGFIEKYLPEALHYIGCELQQTHSPDFAERIWGVKALPENGNLTVKMIAPGSPADKAGIAEGDVIFSIDDTPLSEVADINGWLNTFASSGHSLQLKSNHRVKEVTLLATGNTTWWNRYHIVKRADATPQQKESFKFWAHQSF